MLHMPSIERTRGVEVEFIQQRYHRTFRDELNLIGARLGQLPDDEGELASAVWVLERRLDIHTRFQEGRLFPAFAAGTRCEPALFEAWAFDALKLFGAIDLVRRRCRYSNVDAELVAFIERLTRHIQDHLAAEALVLAPWTGVESSA
ncbi:MAG: hemerythrin domain-containing protein [Deltaproteobacteria bacterium]|jgi:hypothetical protein|nr:hemerythrin domain-containing protein [Deltaproteobacteria bacterium]